MAASGKKEIEDQIRKDQHFIEKMKSMGEKWCSYTLIIDAMKLSEDRIATNQAELEKLKSND
jgi:hypothetical protein